jgi:nitroreductase
VLAAHALGLGAVWKSSPLMDGPHVRALCRLAGDERLLGWVNVGGTERPPDPGLRPATDLSEAASILTSGDLRPFRR